MTIARFSRSAPGPILGRRWLPKVLGMAIALLVGAPAGAEGQSAGTDAVHLDEIGSPLDPIAVLQNKLDAGEVVFDFDDQHGYLKSVLEALDIPLSSQGLIFSRSSLQTNLITPWTPRAVYYNDDVYVGWVQDSQVLEIASVDPDDGGVFYTLAQNPDGDVQFVEEGTTCLMCHESRSVTDGVPGFMVRSVVVDRFGYPIAPLHEGSTSDRTPFDRRFAGWYVTGTHDGGPHAGNVYAPVLSHEVTDLGRYLSEFDVNSDGNVLDLEGRFDVEPYPTRHSDIVSLMVLTHQTKVHNLITVAHEAAKEAVGGPEMLARIRSGSMPTPDIASVSQVKIDGAVERLLRAMLFSREAPLPGKVEGTTTFATEFEARGPFDEEGRTLRAFDLERRLFRYPLSFLVYTEAFQTLPDLVKEPFYRRLTEVLDGLDPSEDFSHLDAADRTAIREILEATLPEYGAFVAATAR